MKYSIVFVFLISLNVHAQSIGIGTSSLSKPSLQSKLSELNSVPFSEVFIDKLRLKAKEFKLTRRGLDLKKAELENDFENIRRICQEINEIKLKADWPTPERKIVSRCMSHLALMSSDERSRLAFQNSAESFENQGVEKKLNLPHQIIDNFKWALINGRAHLTSDVAVTIPSEHFRLTLVSDRFIPETSYLDASEVSNFRPELRPLVTGNCQSGFRYEYGLLDELEIQRLEIIDSSCRRKMFEPSSHGSLTKKFDRKNESFKVPTWVWWLAGGAMAFQVLNQESERPASGTSKRGF